MTLSNNKIRKDAQKVLRPPGDKSHNSKRLTHKIGNVSDTIFAYDLMAILVICLVCIFIYSNILNSSFVFDDRVNIHHNPNIRLTKLTLDGIINAGFKSLASHRPVANVSFALNYYFHRYDVLGFHLVNILIHVITGIILFYFIKVTLVLSNFRNIKIEPEKNASPNKQNCSIQNSINANISTPPRSLDPTSTQLLFIAFFSTFIWLVHPIQTQTVSYVVQRMNSMAAMFYILSLLFYVKGRLANTKRKKLILFLGSMLSGILSLGSKEIAATLPFFILLYEWFFFQTVSLKWLKRHSIYFICIFLFVILLAFFFLGTNPIKVILSTYNTRDFTLWQRVLTEFRVVIFYMSLLIFPHPERLNLLHDFSISHSFIDPITTLLSFIAIAGLMVTAIWLAKRERLLSFCILWFLGHLVIESSVLGLEIIFEHRVYLPSMFFILALVSLAYRFVNSKRILCVLLCVVVIIFSLWTYQRNIVWSDDVILWKDSVKKSPHQFRQNYNLGIALASRGNVDDAIKQYCIALKFNPAHAKTYYGLGNALARKGDARAAIYNYNKALEINPNYLEAHYNKSRILLNQGKIEEAVDSYQKALIINSEMTQVLYNLSWIYATCEIEKYRNGKKAVKLAEKLCVLTDYQQPLALDSLAAAYAESGRFDEAVATAQKALKLALKLGPEELALELKKRLELYQARQPYRQRVKQKNRS
jgi:Flp pilus assembly protein TadD